MKITMNSIKFKRTYPRKRSRLTPRQRTKMSTRTVVLMTATLMSLIVVGSIFFINIINHRIAFAVTIEQYRSASSGNWNSASTWQRYTATGWVTASNPPSDVDGTITIQSGHTVTVNSSVNADELIVSSGGILNVTSSTLTIKNGTGDDLTMKGSVQVSSTGTLQIDNSSSARIYGLLILSAGTITINSGGTINIDTLGRFRRDGGSIPTSSGYWIVNSGGTFQHNIDGSTIPLATWNTGSIIEVTGTIANLPANLNQNFKDFTIDFPNMNAPLNLNGFLQNVAGNFTVKSTGSSYIMVDQQGNQSVLTIGGNYIMQGGTVFGCMNGGAVINIAGNYIQTGGVFAFSMAGGTAYGNTSMQMNVSGSVLVSGGTMDMSQCDANNSSKGNGKLYVTGNLDISGTGLITETSLGSHGQVYFVGIQVQYFTSAVADTQNVDFIVNPGATLNMTNQIMTSSGNFTLMDNGALIIGSANGITNTSLSGNIQVTGIRSYSINADYTYNGLTTQNTGDGLPSTVHNLTINNNNNVTLTSNATVSNILTFTTGLVMAANDTLTLGTSSTNLGTLNRTTGHIVGYFKRWVGNLNRSNLLFPVGTSSIYNPAVISYATNPTTFGTITSKFVPTSPGISGLPITESGDICINAGYAYWSLMANNLSGSTFTLNLYATGFWGITDYTKLHIFRRPSAGSPFALKGTYVLGTGSIIAPIANRSVLNVFGHFGIFSGSSNALPIELIYFNTKLNDNHVNLSWSTASELNNDYFTVERSTDGSHFEELHRKQGAGNSTSTLNYTDVDENPLQSYSYYRLKQTDYDGHFTYSEIKTVKNNSKDNEDANLKIISVAPNPFGERFTCSFTLKTVTNVELQLFNSSGQIAYKDMIIPHDGMNQYDFTDEKGLAPGIYFLNLIYNDQKVTQKIIKK